MNEAFQKRIRVFAGPNGSGKTTVVTKVKSLIIDGNPIDFGIVVNADDIAKRLREKSELPFSDYRLKIDAAEFQTIYIESKLFARHSEQGANPNEWFEIKENRINLLHEESVERVAQVTAWVILQKLLANGEKISFETVFSSVEKIKLLEQAKSLGYKVYLYFISTASPTINIQRVNQRVMQGGHHVGETDIVRRYRNSLDNLYRALKYVHRSFIMDNSTEFGPQLLARLLVDEAEIFHWEDVATQDLPNWFIESCVNHDQFLRAIITRN